MSGAHGSVSEALEAAEEAARTAGRFLAAHAGTAQQTVLDTARDVKLQVDRDAEDRIVSVLAAHSNIPIVAEERCAGGEPHTAEGLHWIVDPLDGTLNYRQRIPFCCVSVALWNGNEPLAGVVYDFNHDEMFSAAVGTGAWLNGSPIRVQPSPPERGVLCTGFPASTEFTPDAVARFAAHVTRFRKVRLMGSAALSLAYVAAGRADAYFERDILIWDVAAGLAVVAAAGGAITYSASRVPRGLIVYAHNGACPWPEMAGS